MPRTLEQHLFAPGPKRVLALDGGGVKGIITIAFLEKMEEILRARSGRGDDFRLSDYFDLVGGTSVGALLATLIALGYPMSEIKTMFYSWTPRIFRRPWRGFRLFAPRFSSRGLKKITRKLLKERTLESSDLKTGLAIITKRIDTGSTWVLTNNPRAKYWNDPADNSYLGNRHYRIADVVRASTAAPYYFAPKRIRVAPKTARPRMPPGLFVDGGVSPFNNPALMLFMLAGIKGYGFQWDLGAHHLFMASVGTGSYRMPLKSSFLLRRIPGFFAAKAIHGLVGDSDVLSLTLLQWLSAPRRSWEINSEIGTLEGELLGPADYKGDPKPLLSFVRYDTRLEAPWLSSTLGERLERALNEVFIEGLKQLDRPGMMGDMYHIGALAAEIQVTPDDFPSTFDVPTEPERQADFPPEGQSMFTIESTGIFRKRNRLVSTTKLTDVDFRRVAERIGSKPFKARKIGFVAARKAEQEETIDTWLDGKETTATAQPGDWVVTNLSPDSEILRDKDGRENTYVIKAETFPNIYDSLDGGNQFGQFFKSKNVVDAIYLSGGFDVLAPWGQKQTAEVGYLLSDGRDVYGNNAQTFEATYEIMHG